MLFTGVMALHFRISSHLLGLLLEGCQVSEEVRVGPSAEHVGRLLPDFVL